MPQAETRSGEFVVDETIEVEEGWNALSERPDLGITLAAKAAARTATAVRTFS